MPTIDTNLVVKMKCYQFGHQNSDFGHREKPIKTRNPKMESKFGTKCLQIGYFSSPVQSNDHITIVLDPQSARPLLCRRTNRMYPVIIDIARTVPTLEKS